jgi:hypothetical protein
MVASNDGISRSLRFEKYHLHFSFRQGKVTVMGIYDVAWHQASQAEIKVEAQRRLNGLSTVVK